MSNGYPIHATNYEIVGLKTKGFVGDPLFSDQSLSYVMDKQIRLFDENNYPLAKLKFITEYTDEQERPIGRVIWDFIKDTEGNDHDPESVEFAAMANPYAIRADLLNEHPDYALSLEVITALVAEEVEVVDDEEIIAERGVIVFQAISKAVGELAVCDTLKFIVHEDASSLAFRDHVDLAVSE